MVCVFAAQHTPPAQISHFPGEQMVGSSHADPTHGIGIADWQHTPLKLATFGHGLVAPLLASESPPVAAPLPAAPLVATPLVLPLPSGLSDTMSGTLQPKAERPMATRNQRFIANLIVCREG